MRLSAFFYKSIKEVPNDADLKSHKLLIRGGYIKQVSAGIFSYLPIAVKVLKKIENIIREEMNVIDGFEVNMPVVMPAALWNETGRYKDVGDELVRFEDRTGRKMLLGMTHEEAVTDLARYVVNSYKQLPFMLYQIQTKFRDEPRVRGGLIRVREFVMKDAYSFHANFEDLDKYYERAYQAYFKIFNRCGLPAISVASDVGMMGGSAAHEFMAVTESGEDTLIICTKCDYKANKEVAKTKRKYKKEEIKQKEEVFTPNLKSIEEVSDFLKIEKNQTCKSVIYDVNRELILCMIRGNIEINEIKLKNYLKVKELTFADEDLLKKSKIIPGYASPIGIENIRVIIDESVANSYNLVSGANKKDYHFINTNFNVDYTSKEVLDISEVKDGNNCPACNSKLRLTRGIEIGNIFKLGTKYSKAMSAKFLDENGKSQDIIMGCYGIGVGRLMASVIEVANDENKIIWPISITPFEVEIISLAADKEEKVRITSEDIYKKLIENNFEVIYDDRKATAGFKFNDADLIGAPIRITIGEKSLNNGGAEVKINNHESQIISIDKLLDFLIKNKKDLYEKLKC